MYEQYDNNKQFVVATTVGFWQTVLGQMIDY